MEKKYIGLLGATGYTGLELLKLLERHPSLEVDFVTSERHAGTSLQEMFPFLRGRKYGALRFIPLQEALSRKVDGVFSCLPHQTAAEKLLPFIEQTDAVIVDLSADFRMRDASIYEAYYCPHPKPELCSQAVYGLVEQYQEVVSTAKLIGSPGCYPTSILLPLLPLVQKGLLELDSIIADAKSGVSGAGKAATAGTHYIEANENFSAYKVADEHRHLSEIQEQLSLASGEDVEVLFTPHLVPMARGILSTIYAKPKAGVTQAQVEEALSEAYASSEFVHFCGSELPKTAWVRDTNRCLFGLKWSSSRNTLVLVSVIDNLIKGASGQALQNMNVALGVPASDGLC